MGSSIRARIERKQRRQDYQLGLQRNARTYVEGQEKLPADILPELRYHIRSVLSDRKYRSNVEFIKWVAKTSSYIFNPKHQQHLDEIIEETKVQLRS